MDAETEPRAACVVIHASFDTYQVLSRPPHDPSREGRPQRARIEEWTYRRPSSLSAGLLLHRYGEVWVASADRWRVEEHQFPDIHTLHMRNGEEHVVNAWSGMRIEADRGADDEYGTVYRMRVPREVLALAHPSMLLLGYERRPGTAITGTWHGHAATQEVHRVIPENRLIGLNRFGAEILRTMRLDDTGWIVSVEAYKNDAIEYLMCLRDVDVVREDLDLLFTPEACREFLTG